jgi:indolepyruvate ferredoxin oxidoreductase
MVANADVLPTGEFQTNRDLDLSATRFVSAIARRIESANVETVRAGSLATRMVGDSIYANLMMVGFAAQRGLLPVGIAALEEAVRLNGVKVQDNLDALALGRLAAVDPEALWALSGLSQDLPGEPRTLEGMLESRTRLLTRYQNAAYANRYRKFVGEIEVRLATRGIADAEPFLLEVARNLAKLMAYKDEYEVARLYSDPAFIAGLRETFSGSPELALNFGSPLLSWKKDARTGRPKKVELGGWIFPVLRLLRHGRLLRGTPFDPLGYTQDRRLERALIGEYEALVGTLAEEVTPATLDQATRIAALPALIAGYGPVKEAGAEAYRASVEQQLAAFRLETAGRDETSPAVTA